MNFGRGPNTGGARNVGVCSPCDGSDGLNKVGGGAFMGIVPGVGCPIARFPGRGGTGVVYTPGALPYPCPVIEGVGAVHRIGSLFIGCVGGGSGRSPEYGTC